MGTPIHHGTEFFIHVFLRNGWNDSAIARVLRCNRKTVRSVREGRTLRSIWEGKNIQRRPSSPPPEPGLAEDTEEPSPEPCQPYVCEGCSETAGRIVRVTLRPCVACQARLARQSEAALL